MNKLAFSIFLAISGLFTFAAAAEPRTNVVLFLIDDFGATDVGCEGSPFYETPHLDKLAAEGLRFTSAYSACTVCSPTRAAVLTGKYPAQLHLTDWIAGHARPSAKLLPPEWTKQLPPDEVTLAEELKSARYATCHVGKWHLGPEACWPTEQGFELNFGGSSQGQPPSYFDPYKIPTLAPRREGEYLTDRLTDEAIQFIRKNRENNFFLNFWHYAVHTPLSAPPALVEKYKQKAKPGDPQHNATYAAMVESMDASVGRVLATLDELKLADRTLVIFTSDNGGLVLNNVTSNLGLRAGKGSAYEGGVRVPLYMRLPGTIPAGKTSAVPVMSIDLAPTILEVTGAAKIATAKLAPDGESLAPLFAGGALKRNSIYWHYPHYHPGGATPYSAVRSGDYKLIEFFEDDRLELYKITGDPNEQNNLVTFEPERAKTMREQLAAWRKEVGAQLPVANANYDPEKEKGKGKKKENAK